MKIVVSKRKNKITGVCCFPANHSLCVFAIWNGMPTKCHQCPIAKFFTDIIAPTNLKTIEIQKGTIFLGREKRVK